MNIEGSLIIVSAPSGTGKTSLVAAALDALPNLKKSVSHTTRDMRVGEQDKVHYNFVTEPEFMEMLDQGMFLEHAMVFGKHYGTSRAWVEQTLRSGIDVILEIDWQGAQQIRSKMPDVVSIFILPPSSTALLERLVNRKQDDPEKIAIRLNDAKTEVSHYTEYDYLMVNDDFQVALQRLISIIEVSRLRVCRQKYLRQQLIEQICSKP
jgi:guanylate kinase